MKQFAFIFPGQGAQFVGMGKNYYENCGRAKEVFEKADSIIDGLSDIIFNGPQETLTLTRYCQPAILTCSYAGFVALRQEERFKDMDVRFVAGLSLGEYSALCASGALSFEDTLRLVVKRSEFMEEACKLNAGAMAAVIGMDECRLVEICKAGGVEVANFNSPEQIVITGEKEKIEKVSSDLTGSGAKRVIPLAVSGAFHSSLMKSAEEKFAVELEKVNFKNAGIPIISNVDALPVTEASAIKLNLARQITSSVQWIKTIQYAESQGIKDFVEIGPGTVLKGLVRKINKDLVVESW